MTKLEWKKMHDEANKNCNELSNTPREAYENNWKIKFD